MTDDDKLFFMKTDEQQIRDLFTEWHQAATAGDVSRLVPLMAEDVVFLLPGQPPMRGRETFVAAFRAGLDRIRIQSTGKIEELRISGDMAYLWSYLEVTVTPLQGGSPMRRSGYTLTLLRKEPDGRWVLFRDANMLTPEGSKS
jgi:uncharacterized protein (TIGR02246 family)